MDENKKNQLPDDDELIPIKRNPSPITPPSAPREGAAKPAAPRARRSVPTAAKKPTVKPTAAKAEAPKVAAKPTVAKAEAPKVAAKPTVAKPVQPKPPATPAAKPVQPKPTAAQPKPIQPKPVAPIPPAPTIPTEPKPKPDEDMVQTRLSDKPRVTPQHRPAPATTYGAPTKSYNTLSSVLKAMIYIVAVLVVSGICAYFVIVLANDIFAFVKSDEVIRVTINEGDDINDIAATLSEKGVIAYPDVFKLYAKLKKDSGKFVAGEYEISPSENYSQLLGDFKYKFTRSTVRVAIPEGYTVDEIIDLFVEENKIGTREGFVEAINNYDFDYDFVRDIKMTADRTYRLEGYLFPNTYKFYTDATEVQVIYKLLAEFDNKFADVYYERAKELGLTVDEVVTLASIIEKETKYLDEFEYVASVLHNRLFASATYPYFECDSTIYYIIAHDTGERPTALTASDLKYDSPYNSYTHKGLPPGPIANPGYNAISVALYPASTNYYYFLSNSAGHMTFSRTLDEHNIAKANNR